MNEETFKKILSLIFKVIIKNNGFLSQLEIFRDVRILMNEYFSIKGKINFYTNIRMRSDSKNCSRQKRRFQRYP